MAQLNTQDDEWGFLLKMQAERARQQEIEIKQQEELRKRKYKEQLEQMIAVSQNRNRNNRNEDAEMMRILEKNTQAQIDSQKQHNMLLQKQKADFARENLRTKEEHIRKQISERLRQNKIFQQNYRRQLEQQQRSRQIEQQQKRRQMNTLAIAYENKMHQTESNKLHMKYQDKHISEENQRLEQNKQRQRRELLDKIKYGYHQNPETFQTYAQLLRKKQQDKHNVISKYIKEDQNHQLETLEKSLFVNQVRSPNSTGHSHRSNLNNNHLAQIDRQLEDVRQRKLDPHLSEQQLQRLKDVQKKLEFRRSLQLQIEQRNHRKINQKRMDNIEVRLNKQAFTGQLMLPGLSTNDYQRVRQRQIINDSMGVRARIKTLEDVRPSREGFYMP